MDSNPKLTPAQMVQAVRAMAQGWKFDVVAMGYPGRGLAWAADLEPHHLGRGWVGFDYAAAFGKPVRIINDAAMQAIGSYEGGRMLFLGLGTGLGSALILGGVIEPHGAGPPALSQGPYLRGLCGHCRCRPTGQEALAASRL